jgi:hypothetical protein
VQDDAQLVGYRRAGLGRRAWAQAVEERVHVLGELDRPLPATALVEQAGDRACPPHA